MIKKKEQIKKNVNQNKQTKIPDDLLKLLKRPDWIYAYRIDDLITDFAHNFELRFSVIFLTCFSPSIFVFTSEMVEKYILNAILIFRTKQSC